MSDVAVSILIATFNRAAILEETLDSLIDSVTVSRLKVEILVLDNNSSDSTRQVVAAKSAKYPLQYCFVEKPGKNSALNVGIGIAKGDCLIFTDDDVAMQPGWVEAYWSAYLQQGKSSFFGGPIHPRFPKQSPAWVHFPCFDFAALDYGPVDRPLMDTEIIHGGNMAVRASIFAGGVRFNETIGPCGKSGMKGSETSLQIDLRRQGHQGFYVSGAVVEHRIDNHPHFLRRRYHFRRKFLEGRGRVHMGKSEPGKWVILRRFPIIPLVELLQLLARWTKEWFRKGSFQRRCELEMQLAFCAGRTYEFYSRGLRGLRIPVT